MTLVAVGGPGIPLGFPAVPGISVTGIPSITSTAMDAAGEKAAVVGHVHFAAGPGTSKLVSSAGSAAIAFRTASVTWATAGTTVRIGIQDVSATVGPPTVPDEDWTGEPYGELVQGTDTVTSNTWTSRTITAGSRTLTHGDLIAVVWDMTVRNGADLITKAFLAATGSAQRPVLLSKIGAGPTWATVNGVGNLVITTDDGTLCTISGCIPVSAVTTLTIGTGSNPDEVGNVLIPTGKIGATEMWTTVAPAAEFEAKMYSGSVATPTQEQLITVDVNQVAVATGNPMRIPFSALEEMTAGSTYAFTIRPTGVATMSAYEMQAFDAAHTVFWPLGSSMYKCTREGNTGALTTDTARRVMVGPCMSHWDDGAGGGSRARINGLL